jgi:NAD(P)-dependent dehydrogenase (short-subunit alcohol dehydrogenase family)
MKTVLITGATKGIGRAIALEMGAEGASVVLNYASDDASAERTLQECRARGHRAFLVKADVSDRSQVERLTRETLEHLGSIDVLVTCAGLNRDAPFLSMSEEDWDRVIDVNLKGTFLIAQSMASVMRNQPRGGLVLTVAATTGITGRAGGANYCAAKAGVLTLTKCMAIELGPKVRVNCVVPGFTRTEETAARFGLPDREPEEIARRRIPLARIGEPRDIARVVKFLTTEEGAYINGQKIIVDGGEYPF